MLEDIINKGILEMSAEPFELADAIVPWSGFLSVRVLVAVSVLLFFLFARDIIFIFPFILECTTRSKANASLEHSISTARIRNEVAALMVIPFCLIADRFKFYEPSFMNAIRPDLTVLCLFGVLVTYLLIRLTCFALFKPLRLSFEAAATVKHIPYNCFIALVAVLLVTTCLVTVFHVSDYLAKTVLLWETALFYLLSIIRVFQFLMHKCTSFATFLYLCALEFLPTGLLLASEFVL